MFSFLTSRALNLFLLAGLVLVLISASVSQIPLFMVVVRLLLAALAVNACLCTAWHWRHLTVSVITLHSGALLVLLATLLSRAGFVATINIHEGGESATAFRWDKEQDVALGFTLRVLKVHHEYYPSGIQVGVHLDGKPLKLFQARTGESFEVLGYQVDILDLDPTIPALRLALLDRKGGRTSKTVTKETDLSQPGLSLQLVAFQTPFLKRTWVDIEIIPAGGTPFVGHAEVNRPLQWQGLRFFHTATGVDPAGQTYAGIQIVKDQGIPFVYSGFVLVCLGSGLLLWEKIGKRRRALGGMAC